MEIKNCSKIGEHITVIIECLIEHPMCIHGPTLLLKKTFDSGADPIQFYACSAYRNPKECPILQNKDIVRKRAQLAKTRFKSTVIGLAEITKLSTKKRAYCHTCACLFTSNEKIFHQNHDFVIGISDTLLRQPTHFLKPLANDSREAQYFFSNSTLECIVNMFKKSGLSANSIGKKYILECLEIICRTLESVG